MFRLRDISTLSTIYIFRDLFISGDQLNRKKIRKTVELLIKSQSLRYVWRLHFRCWSWKLTIALDQFLRCLTDDSLLLFNYRGTHDLSLFSTQHQMWFIQSQRRIWNLSMPVYLPNFLRITNINKDPDRDAPALNPELSTVSDDEQAQILHLERKLVGPSRLRHLKISSLGNPHWRRRSPNWIIAVSTGKSSWNMKIFQR